MQKVGAKKVMLWAFLPWLLRSHSLILGQRNPQTSCGPQFGSSSFEEGQTDHFGWCTGQLKSCFRLTSSAGC